jgi:hypothetical protein
MPNSDTLARGGRPPGFAALSGGFNPRPAIPADPFLVVPAKAGTHASGDVCAATSPICGSAVWVPAFAGTTNFDGA